MVVNGDHGTANDFATSTEIIDLEDPTNHCSSIEFPIKVSYNIAGLVKPDVPLLCGGNHEGSATDQCYALRNRKYVKVNNINVMRH